MSSIHVIGKNSQRVFIMFFSGEYPDNCPLCKCNEIAIDEDGFGCIGCGEIFTLLTTPEQIDWAWHIIQS